MAFNKKWLTRLEIVEPACHGIMQPLRTMRWNSTSLAGFPMSEWKCKTDNDRVILYVSIYISCK